MPLIRFLGGGLLGPSAPYVAAFRKRSWAKLVTSRAIKYRRVKDNYDRLPALATNLVSRKADLIAALQRRSP